jgi:hypothetical protein
MLRKLYKAVGLFYKNIEWDIFIQNLTIKFCEIFGLKLSC